MARANLPSRWRNLFIFIVLSLQPSLHAAGGGTSRSIGWHHLTVKEFKDIDTLDGALKSATTTLESRERAISNRNRRDKKDANGWLESSIPDIQKFLGSLQARLPCTTELVARWNAYLTSGHDGTEPAFTVTDWGLRTLKKSPPSVTDHLSQIIHSGDFDPNALDCHEIDFLVCYYAQADGFCSSTHEDRIDWSEDKFLTALQCCNNLIALYREEIARRFEHSPFDSDRWAPATLDARQKLEMQVLLLLDWKIATLMDFSTRHNEEGRRWHLREAVEVAQEIDSALSGKGDETATLMLPKSKHSHEDDYVSNLHKRVMNLIQLATPLQTDNPS